MSEAALLAHACEGRQEEEEEEEGEQELFAPDSTFFAQGSFKPGFKRICLCQNLGELYSVAEGLMGLRESGRYSYLCSWPVPVARSLQACFLAVLTAICVVSRNS